MGSKPALLTFSLPLPQKPLTPPPTTEAGPSRPRSPINDLTYSAQQLSIADGDPDAHSATPLKSSEISTLLSVALLRALTHLEASIFPMPASLLYSAHILPNRPAYIPKEKREDVVVCKSEWKKLAKWMKEVSKEGLMKIKETKGEVTVQGCVIVQTGDDTRLMINSYDPQHPSLQTHSSFTTIGEEEVKAAKLVAREAATQAGVASTTNSGKDKGRKIVIEELWKPSGGAMSFWEAAHVE